MKSIVLRLLVFFLNRVSKTHRLQHFLECHIAKLSGGKMYSMELRDIYNKKYNIDIGYGSYGGCFSVQNMPKGVKFGNYCSIAPNIRIFRANHPQNTFTTHPLLYNPVAGFVDKDMLSRPNLVIGHDVWIGEWVIILPSVNTIGNGAIIGAGAIVTKDVPPYAIVAGNPAKIVRMRFSEEVIEKLESTKWWLWDKDTLIKNIDNLQGIFRGKY